MRAADVAKSITNATELEQALTIAAASLREGEVISYGDLASRAGRPDAPRAAGALLSKSLTTLPWWRVVYSDGRLAPCDPATQQDHLESEGCVVKNGRVFSSPLGRFKSHEKGDRDSHDRLY